MHPCEQCNERLLDYVYGLLEGVELQETREHLESCAACQLALEQTQREQSLMARAAKAIHDVPEFTLPADTIETMPATSAPVAPAASSLPQGSPPNPHRPLWRRPWLAWTIAASLLFVIGGSFSFHQYRLTGLQKDLAAQRNQFRETEIAYEALPTKYELLQKREIDRLRDAASPYVHIVGPTQLQPNAKAQLRITTRNADGELTPSSLRVKLVEVPTGNIVQIKRLTSDRDGHAALELDASKAQANSILQVVVEAEIGVSQATVKDTIRLQPPTYVTRVDINKIVYQIDDVLFFRVLVLDRCSLQPPAQPILVRVTLKNPKDEVVAQLDAPTSEGGILAREFPISQAFLAGNYTLNVSPLDPAQTLVQSATHRLEVVRDLRTPDIQLDQDRYFAGDKITGIVRGGGVPERATGTFGQGLPVPVTIEPQVGGFGGGPGLPGAGAMSAAAKDGKGAKKSLPTSDLAMQRFSATLPAELPDGARYLPFKLQFENGKQKQEYRGVVPIEPTDYDIDFFPEGGDLIAGVLNRVYYRVRSGDGEAVTGEGRVILMSGKNEFVDSRYHLGLGYLDFTPHTKETYSVRITSPVKTMEIARPFAKLGAIRPIGVVLHIPSAVGKQGDAIRLTLRNQGPARKLLLAAHCRGQIVDQRWVDIKTGSQDFTLQPTQDARGMVKVTAYEVAAHEPEAADRIDAALNRNPGAEGLLPIAERLVYRTPVQRLELGLQLNTQQHEPGKNLQLNITARTESGELTSGWLLASVVDERFQPLSRSLSAHFMLLNEIRTGSELEDAQVVLHDSPESTAMLERFLGTHGWRRFLHPNEPALTVLAARPNDASAMVFSRESMPLEQLQRINEAKVAAVLDPLRKAAFTEEINLKAERAHLSGMVLLAENQLHEAEESVHLAIRLSLGAFQGLLLVVSLALMAVGIYRLVRQAKAATPMFGGAFGCLAACLIVVFVGSLLGPLRPTPVGMAEARIALGRQIEDKLAERLAQDPMHRAQAEATAPVGAFAMRGPKPMVNPVASNVRAPKDHLALMKEAAAALQEQQLAHMARLNQSDRSGNATQNRINNQSQDLRRLIARSQPTLIAPEKATAKTDQPKAVAVSPNSNAKKSGVLESATAPPNVPGPPMIAGDEIEYAFKYAPKTFADTLLWHPRLLIVNGQADARFDIATGQASYRVLLLGHGPSGRFGFHESRFDVLSVGR